MKHKALDALTPYDVVYVSAHAHDAAASCFERMASERGRGLRTLLVTLFPTHGGATGCDADVFDVGLEPAPQREAEYRSLAGVLYRRARADAEAIERSAWALNEVGHRTRAKRVYVPLAVGGHADHRIAHEAALRVFHGDAGRDVYLYEDRPYALLPGAVRLRLAQIGVQLPPAAVGAARGPGALRLALAVAGADHVREHCRGFGDRLACALRALQAGRQAKGWRPQRAFGPRLQPIVHDAPGPSSAPGRADHDALCGSAAATDLAGAYAHGLGVPPGSERYWLLLPARVDGVIEPATDDLEASIS